MGAYYINGFNLTDFGIVAGQAPDSNLAITGAWDMPSRIGKIFHEWPDENGVEPYLRADEIFFGGRDITFYGYVWADSRPDAVVKVQEFHDELDLLSGGLFPLTSDWGSWNVQALQGAKVGHIAQGKCRVQMTFREPVVDMSGTIPAPSNSGTGIDGISFNDLGVVKILTSDNMDRAASKQNEVTAYGFEKIGVTRRGLREFSLRFLIHQTDYMSFNQVIHNLYALLSSPGARTLRLDDGTVREVFVKDGFQVSGVRKTSQGVYGFIDIKFSEIRLLETWNLLTNETGSILTDSYGRPLTDIIKGF